MLTCPHSLDHIPRLQHNRPCHLERKTSSTSSLCFKTEPEKCTWLGSNWNETKIDPLYCYIVQRSAVYCSVCIDTEPTSAVINQCVQSIHAGPWVVQTWNCADKWNYTQTIQRSVKSGGHEFTLGKNWEEKSLLASEHQRHIFNIHPRASLSEVSHTDGFTNECGRTAYHRRVKKIL